MAQAGIHGLVGVMLRKVVPQRKWLLLGIVSGNLLPDLDNIAVAFATVTGASTEGLHRTFTHSIFFCLLILIIFYLISVAGKDKKWWNLGLGLSLGVLLHILLDLLVWFNGVEILWPLPSWINFWGEVSPLEWWSKLMMPVENLFIALLFIWINRIALMNKTDLAFLKQLRFWTWIQLGLFIVFLCLVYTLNSGFMTIFGAVYLLSLGLAIWIVIRMRNTIEFYQVS